jgi:S1-C subfamily serine protease
MPLDSDPPLRITADELRRISVWRPAAPPQVMIESRAGDDERNGPRNGVAVASFVTAVAGIPLFGLVTGLVAIVLGCAALLRQNRRAMRGTEFAVAGIALGAADVAGWMIAIAFLFPFDVGAREMADFEPEAAALDNLDLPIQRAMKANALVEGHSGWRGTGGKTVGSGVILRIAAGQAFVLTNRHVVDPNFAEEHKADIRASDLTQAFTVKVVGQSAQPAHAVWIAPDGIDLAIVSLPVQSADAMEASWGSDKNLHIGDEVFAIGNPHGLGWTHTSGAVSQFRQQAVQGRSVRVIQTNAAINPGNSGGGLYTTDGRLVGITTWTRDKRVAEGLSFAIAFDTLIALDPDCLKTVGGKPEP